MLNWEFSELKVKFADRLDALKTMKWLPKSKILKKLSETKKYFLIDEIKNKIDANQYNKLYFAYNKLIKWLKKTDITAYNGVLNNMQ